MGHIGGNGTRLVGGGQMGSDPVRFPPPSHERPSEITPAFLKRVCLARDQVIPTLLQVISTRHPQTSRPSRQAALVHARHDSYMAEGECRPDREMNVCVDGVNGVCVRVCVCVFGVHLQLVGVTPFDTESPTS